jgi:DNA polymerase-1
MAGYEPYSLIKRARKFVEEGDSKKEEGKSQKKLEHRGTKNYELLPLPTFSTNGHGELSGSVFPPSKKPKKAQTKPKKKKKNPASLLSIARANRHLREEHNLVSRRQDVDGVREWLKKTSEVALDTETYGVAASAGARRKTALSFVKGRVRLIQLSADGTTYLIDARLLHKEDVASILTKLQGKTLYCHNAIFDLPRIKRHFGVDLMSEDVRDTLVLSRLARAGEWEENEDSDPVAMRHGLGEILKREGVANIDKEVDHKWEEALTDERLRYATDDVRYLQDLHKVLMELVEKRNLAEGLELFRDVYPVYLKMQYEGQPVDEDRLKEYTEKVSNKVEEARAALEEHQPHHPEDGAWVWGNKQPFDEDNPSVGIGRNGARRALHQAGITLSNLKKPTRMAYLKKHPEASPLLRVLNDYYLYSDLLSDSKDWLTYFVEDGRIYANVKPFSQVTGRTAYANPALQNAPKEVDKAIGISLRDCIKPQEGHALVKADYAAQELRILAEVTGDTGLIASFGGGDDPHVRVAEKIAGRPLRKDDPEYTVYRKLGKRANYGFSYGAGAARYETSVFEDTYERISVKQARLEQAAFRKTWPDVYTWQQSNGSRDGTSEDDWFTTSFTGRRRYVSPRWDQLLGARKPNYCDRLNGPIQAGGADMLYIALKFLLEDQRAGIYENVRIIITTHDEIVLEVSKDELAGVKDWLEVAMRVAAKGFLRDELAGSDCVEAEEVPSWGGR